VALDAVAGCGEDVLAVVAGTARVAFSHIVHGGLADNSLEWEYLGVAVFAYVGSSMDVVAEGGGAHAIEVEHDIPGLHAFVALGAVAGCGEDVLTIVAGAA